tara:strand:- start:145 stop:873 length:729 start_codon:yes stop_codon:yes gene_type:complete
MKNLSVIVPCYNYETYILNNIEKLIIKLEAHNINYELIIIDDGSLDNTKKKIETILENKRINLVINNENKGKSFSIVNALPTCKFDEILLIDCDLPYFEYLDKVLYEIYNNYDLICINRRSKESVLINKNLSSYQKTRFRLGNFIGKLINFFLKIDLEGTDTQAGLKVFKKDNQFNKLNFFSKKYFFDLELIYHYRKNKKKILSIPVRYEIAEESNIQIFSFKNFYILYEFFKIVLILKFFS